jgi:hypothetical protein
MGILLARCPYPFRHSVYFSKKMGEWASPIMNKW